MGQTVTLPCVVQGEPSPEISWFHNGRPVRVEDGGVLRIQRATLADQGTYRCVAKNDAGEDTLEIKLEVLSKCFLQHQNPVATPALDPVPNPVATPALDLVLNHVPNPAATLH